MCNKKNIYHLDLGGRFHLCGKVKGKYLYNLSALNIESVNCPDCIRLFGSIGKKNNCSIKLKESDLFCVGNKLYAYRMLYNSFTGDYEIILRGAGIVCKVPCPVGFSRSDHEYLFKSIMRGFTDDLCNHDHDDYEFSFFGSDWNILLDSEVYDDSFYEPSESPIVEYDGFIISDLKDK